MFRKMIHNLQKRRGLRAGRKSVSVEQAIKDYEKFGPGYVEGAMSEGKTLHVRRSGKSYKVISEGTRSCYEIPRPDIIESVEGEDKGKQYDTYDRLSGERYYR